MGGGGWCRSGGRVLKRDSSPWKRNNGGFREI